MRYIIALDQSTQGTKGLLLDEKGMPVCRVSRPHEQIVLPNGYVEHNPEEIYHNVIGVVRFMSCVREALETSVRNSFPPVKR